jgi:outer membrane protein insertion porin family
MTCSRLSKLTNRQSSLRRVPRIAACTVTAIAAWEGHQAAQANPMPVVESTAPTEAAIPIAIQAVEMPVAAAVAPPEQVAGSEFSKALEPANGEPSQVRYYQEYQAVEVVEGTVGDDRPPEPIAPPSTATQTAAIANPDWMLPPGLPESSQVGQVTPPPAITPTQTPTRSLPQAAPNRPATTTPDLAVTATEVQVTGTNDPALQQLVRNTVQTKPGGATSQVQLQNDVSALLNTGLFTNVNVAASPNPVGVSVNFLVEPIVVQAIQLSNARVLTQAVANELLQPQLGQPISPPLLDEGVRQINQWYAQNGYSLARVLTVRPASNGVVTIDVAEGLVGNVRFRFADRNGKFVDDQGKPIQGRTRESFLRQETQVEPGQVFREDVAREDLQRLAKLGLFERVNLTFEGDARQVDVIYDLVETRARAVNLGAGYNTDAGLYGTVSYRDDNFGGVGQQFSNNFQIGQRIFTFDTRFTNPYRASTPDRLGYSINAFRRRFASAVFDEDIRLPNGDRVRESKFGGGIAFIRPIAPEWQGTLGLNYTRTSIRDREGGVARFDERGNPLSFSGEGIDDLYTVSFAATRDLRNNSIEPTQGSILTLSTEQSIPLGLGSILNNRLQANYAQYIPVNLINFPEEQRQDPDPQAFKEVFAFNLQGGTIIGDLPPYNAYNLGGSNSVRGYGNGDVTTGRSYFLASAEYRFPVYRFIGGVLFADFGTDLGSADTVPGEPGVERGKPGTGLGIGAGVRVRSPLGILRLDYGFNDQGESRLQFGFGQKF